MAHASMLMQLPYPLPTLPMTADVIRKKVGLSRHMAYLLLRWRYLGACHGDATSDNAIRHWWMILIHSCFQPFDNIHCYGAVLWKMWFVLIACRTSHVTIFRLSALRLVSPDMRDDGLTKKIDTVHCSSQTKSFFPESFMFMFDVHVVLFGL